MGKGQSNAFGADGPREESEKKAEERDPTRQDRGRKKGEDAVEAGFPKRLAPNTIEILREADETVLDMENAEEISEIEGEEAVDEFDQHFSLQNAPKIMITTQKHTCKQMFSFMKEVTNVIPNCTYYKRKNFALKQIVEYAKTKDFTMIMLFTEKAKKVNGMYLTSLPEGPTTFWKLSRLKLGAEIKGGATCSSSYEPELLLNNFTTRLGRRVARQLASLFPQKPNFEGRRSVTFHNQRDFIFFRHYRYDFRKNGTRCGLAEIGPRFTLKLRSVQHGTFDAQNGEFEYQWRPDSQVSRKRMFL